MADELQPKYSDIIFYTSPEGNVSIEVIFNDETFWLNQKRMSELFGVEVNTINYHLKEIFKSGELQEVSTIRKIRTVQTGASSPLIYSVSFCVAQIRNLVAIRLLTRYPTEMIISRL